MKIKIGVLKGELRTIPYKETYRVFIFSIERMNGEKEGLLRNPRY
jgi:hypothetical protein